MGDKLESLPVDNAPLNHNEIALMNNLFQTTYGDTIAKTLSSVKDVLIGAAIVFVLLLPYTDSVVRKVFPLTENSVYIMAGIKAFVFGLLFFVLNNLYLAKKA
jgi:hypothetical protein